MVLINRNTRVIIQGITGHQGSFHSGEMLKFGTNIVAGVSPGRGGSKINNIPVYDTIDEVMDLKPDATMVSVPAPFVKDAALEAIDHGIKFIYILTEHVPVQDTMEIVNQARRKNIFMIGPNGPGITVVGESKIGIMPNNIFRKGRVAVASRSGTLTYEIVNAITQAGLGESTVIGLGGDPIVGTTFTEVVRIFNEDPETDMIVMVGEIGGSEEERAASYVKEHVKKKVVGYITGRSAPPGKRMGHAGAIIEKGAGTAESKIRAFESAGIKVAEYPYQIPDLLKQ
ncbi:succinate--CoA ligase subunit alpha [Picrophilus oshimae]|uniref:Succinate--CoA ligase [ADP-forming] subunit alpha n=1 Tax=Picrophilus torridus (strain ATCC 700027 / DSM 9790 / JCM 10055 / NBRC 100828 / KAW 2/3) TaxID=1122961 RepID=A0A8G2FXF6_PICTO|nr:succinate--CoA ligase subunit alpha [Picrophilus oshimae]SMD31211.1 succinyl-CoA synthetase (ADP-forming) alpha subunit [Picrophilus oshimae DSM 9789]